jgi:proteasome lid subunit RPN8/RPN11
MTSTAAVILPVENELHSPVRFRMAPAEQLKAFYWLEEQNLELSAIFHSHPQGPEHPSETDLADFAYPGVLMLILSPINLIVPLDNIENWQIRVFQIVERFPSGLSASEVPLAVIPESQPGEG